MRYLIANIAILLMFAAAIGVFLGWMLRNVATRAQLQALDQEWSARMLKLRRERDRLHQHTGRLSKRITEAQTEHARTSTLIETLKARVPESTDKALADLRKRIGDLERLARHQENQVARLADKLAQREADIVRLREKLTLTERARSSTEAELRDVREQSEKLRAALAEAAVSRRQAEPVPRPPQRAAKETGRPPEGLWREAPPRVDRLQQINGIGPVLERLLNRLGIYQFRQIARMSKVNVQWLGAHINSFPQRIEREDWVGQARDLHRATYPDEEL